MGVAWKFVARNPDGGAISWTDQRDIQWQGGGADLAENVVYDALNRLVTAEWENLRRVRLLQAETHIRDPQSDRLARHHTRSERTFYHALNELKALQTDDAVRRTLPIRIALRSPVLAAPLNLAKRSRQRDQHRQERTAAA